MKRPRATSAGRRNAGAGVMLGGSDIPSLHRPGPPIYDILRASRLDREADYALFVGRHDRAEYLSHRAADLRQAGAA